MTRDETAKLLAVISATYPNFKVEDKTATIDAWSWALEEYPYNAVQMAFKVYIKTDKSGFSPSVNQLITNIYKPAELQVMSEAEAWAMVKKAISNGYYHAEEEFSKLPPLVQKAVGGASMIRQWAITDSGEVNTVIMSNFQRTFRTLVSREKEKGMLPTELLQQLNTATQGKLLEVNKDA